MPFCFSSSILFSYSTLQPISIAVNDLMWFEGRSWKKEEEDNANNQQTNYYEVIILLRMKT